MSFEPPKSRVTVLYKGREREVVGVVLRDSPGLELVIGHPFELADFHDPESVADFTGGLTKTTIVTGRRYWYQTTEGGKREVVTVVGNPDYTPSVAIRLSNGKIKSTLVRYLKEIE